MNRFVLSALLLVMLVGTRLAAQDTTAAPPRWPHPVSGISPAFGVHFGAPSRFALSMALLINGIQTRDGWIGPFVAAEPGISAGRVSVGLAQVLGPGAAGFQYRLSALRTWENSLSVGAAQSYAGPEFRLIFAFATLGAGRYWRTAGREPGEGAFWAMIYGVMF